MGRKSTLNLGVSSKNFAEYQRIYTQKKVECDCGAIIRKVGLKQHLSTKHHIEKLKFKISKLNSTLN
jgi:hypothetical protein